MAAVAGRPGGVRVQLLHDLRGVCRADVLRALARVEILPEQDGFSLPASAVLEKSRRDPSRQTFAILVDHQGATAVVGIGVLQPDGADATVWPTQEPHVVLRGFSVDRRWQGHGIGTAAAGEAVALAEQAFPAARAVVLTVHVDNLAGQRAYERAGFTFTGRRVSGRAGEELVMARCLSAADQAG